MPVMLNLFLFLRDPFLHHHLKNSFHFFLGFLGLSRKNRNSIETFITLYKNVPYLQLITYLTSVHLNVAKLQLINNLCRKVFSLSYRDA